MEAGLLDPFGDYDSAGYLRNRFAKKSLLVVGHLETAAYERQVLGCIRNLRKPAQLNYQHVLGLHADLFSSVYPWAGQDRSVTAPNIAICKGGYNNLFAHPADAARAATFALQKGQEQSYLRTRPGEVFGYLAHAHPFLEGNGRTILTLYAELSRRAGFNVEWERMQKQEFLKVLTQELLTPGKEVMDRFVLQYMRDGVLSPAVLSRRLRANSGRS